MRLNLKTEENTQKRLTNDKKSGLIRKQKKTHKNEVKFENRRKHTKVANRRKLAKQG